MDILADRDDLVIGSGWFPLETHAGLRFRWVSNDAEVYFAALRAGAYNVSVLIEPGPSCPAPFAIEFRVADGRVMKHVEITGKQRVTLSLPVDVPAVVALTLHAVKAGTPLPNDSRVLTFRVFEIDLERGPADVLPFSMQLGKGWHSLETQNGRQFRWVDNDAEIAVEARAPERFEIEVEAGPSLDAKKFRLYVLGDRGETVAATEIDGRGTFHVNLANTRSRRLKLHVDGGGKRVTTDPRIMNFRVFRPLAT